MRDSVVGSTAVRLTEEFRVALWGSKGSKGSKGSQAAVMVQRDPVHQSGVLLCKDGGQGGARSLTTCKEAI